MVDSSVILSALAWLEEGLERVDVRIEPCLDRGKQEDVVEKAAFDGESLILETGQDGVEVDFLEGIHGLKSVVVENRGCEQFEMGAQRMVLSRRLTWAPAPR